MSKGKLMLRKTGRHRSITMNISYAVEKDGARFHAFAPGLKGLHVDGRSRKKAIENLHKGISIYMRSLENYGDPLPIGPNLTVHKKKRISAKAFRSSVNIKWPSLRMSGTS